MRFANMPDLGPMRLPGAAEYGSEILARAEAALDEVDHRLNIEYGPHPFQRLDVWRPSVPADRPLPVVVLIHGGAFRNGHKEWMAAHAPSVTRLPALLVSPNYRLVPEVDVPGCLDDCGEALRWVYRNIDRYGGDPDTIVLGGHSAGGHLAALLTLDRQRSETMGVPRTALRACFPLCGVFSLVRSELLSDSFFHNIYDEMFADDADAEPVSAYNHLSGNRIPFNLTWGETDVPDVIADNRRFADIAGRQGFLAAANVISGAGHFEAHLKCLDDQYQWMADLKAALYPA